MQENNFEKQVQEKAGELKLNPSDEVWQKVAVAIAKRTKDRRVLAIVFLLLLLTGSAIIFIMQDHIAGKKTGNAISDNVKQDKNNANKVNTYSSIAEMPVVEHHRKTGSKNTSPGKIKTIKDIPLPKYTGERQKHVPLITEVAVNKPGNNNNISSANNAGDINNNRTYSGHKTKGKVNVSTGDNEPQDLTNEKIVTNDTASVAIERIMPLNELSIKEPLMDTVSKAGINMNPDVKKTLDPIQKNSDKKEVAVKGSTRSKQKSKLKIGFNLSFGMAATQNGYLGIGSGSDDKSEFAASYPNQSNGNTSNPGQGSYTQHVPSEIRTGTGLVMGVFIQKDISQKTNLLFGLNYRTYNSTLMTGTRLDSISNISLDNSFYRSGNINRYKNHFHFLELPVAIRYKLGKQNKVPVYWETGISVSRLIGSNAVQFDTSSGLYYKNNNLFNKTQVNISLGLLFSLSGQSKNAFMIGPDINFSLTKMANSGLYKNRHYSYFGILVQKSIGKK